MHAYSESTLREIESAVTGVSTHTLSLPGAGGKWSIAQTLEHLTLAFRANASAMEKALESGELRARTPQLKQVLGRVMVVDLGYFPRVNAPEMTVPSGSISPDESVSAVREALTRLDATLTRISHRFGDDVPVANHPYFAGMTVPQWRKFHWRHTRHHMKQIRERSR